MKPFWTQPELDAVITLWGGRTGRRKPPSGAEIALLSARISRTPATIRCKASDLRKQGKIR